MRVCSIIFEKKKNKFTIVIVLKLHTLKCDQVNRYTIFLILSYVSLNYRQFFVVIRY